MIPQATGCCPRSGPHSLYLFCWQPWRASESRVIWQPSPASPPRSSLQLPSFRCRQNWGCSQLATVLPTDCSLSVGSSSLYSFSINSPIGQVDLPCFRKVSSVSHKTAGYNSSSLPLPSELSSRARPDLELPSLSVEPFLSASAFHRSKPRLCR